MALSNYDPDEIVEIIDEAVFQPGEVDTEWLRVLIKAEFRRKVEAEATWELVTDCADRHQRRLWAAVRDRSRRMPTRRDEQRGTPNG